MPRKNKFILIDGNALIHRAFHALPPLQKKDGTLVNAVYGFVSIFLKVLKDLKPTHIAVTFDLREPTFRHKEYKEYKAKRKKQPQELYDQIPIVKEVVRAFRVPIYEKKGYEADDLIGTIARKVRDKMEVVIVTGDLDTLQLIDDQVKVFTLKRGIADTILYDEKAVKERYDGLTSRQMLDFKTLRGDPSDNIPGVPGIGEKGAIDLLKKFKSVDNLYLAVKAGQAKGVTERYQKLLLAHKKDVELSKRLVKIVDNVPIDFSLEKTRLQDYDQEKVVALFSDLEFKSLLARLPRKEEQSVMNLFSANNASKQSKEYPGYRLIDNNKDFNEFLKELSQQQKFALDTETDGLDPFVNKLLGLSFSWKEGEAYYVPTTENRLKKLGPILEKESVKKFGHNLKFDLEVLSEAGINVSGVSFDTMIASYLLNPGSRQHNLDTIVFAELGHQMIPITALIGPKGKGQLTLAEVPKDKIAIYSAEDADYTFRLVAPLKKRLEEKVNLGLFEKIEMPLVPVLTQVEKNGVKINSNFLVKMSGEFSREIRKVEQKIYRLAGQEFNIASPIQLKEILFEKLKVSTDDIKRTKTGFSTAESELEKLKSRHQIIPFITQFREYSKLKSTYLDTLPKLVNQKTGRVHTSFNQTITATGRLSSSEPNLQNIPVRTEIGREIRKAFIAERGYRLVSIDYSQIELRIVASLANDKKMIEIFNQGEDIHRATAAEINDVSLEKVTSEMRYAAKEVNFGVLYGMGAYGLAWRAEIPREKAQAFIEKYFSVFSGVREYIEQTKALARSVGYVETLFGRRRYLPEINSGVPQIRNAAERMAINAPIQGTAADLIKLAMIKVQKELEGMPGNQDGELVRMILQVHDELVFEVKSDQVKPFSKKVKKIMEEVYQLKVPIKVEVKAGKSWGEMTTISN